MAKILSSSGTWNWYYLVLYVSKTANISITDIPDIPTSSSSWSWSGVASSSASSVPFSSPRFSSSVSGSLPSTEIYNHNLFIIKIANLASLLLLNPLLARGFDSRTSFDSGLSLGAIPKIVFYRDRLNRKWLGVSWPNFYRIIFWYNIYYHYLVYLFGAYWVGGKKGVERGKIRSVKSTCLGG